MKRFVVFFLLISFLLYLPLYSIRKDTKLILDKLQKLEEIIKNFEQKITIISTEFSSLYKKMKIVEEKVTAITRSQADITQNKEKLLLSLQFIKEEINELKNNIAKVNDRLISLPTVGNLSSNNETVKDNNQDPLIQSPESIYYTAYSDYIKKNYKLAIEGFKQFIKLYPNNGLTDNSLYWISQCYYTQKMYMDAVNNFTELINSYKDSDLIPGATLKKGFALIEMGKESEGINVLKGLISKFPLSDEAKLAQQKIKEVMD